MFGFFSVTDNEAIPDLNNICYNPTIKSYSTKCNNKNKM